jgi:hypothetical protein
MKRLIVGVFMLVIVVDCCNFPLKQPKINNNQTFFYHSCRVVAVVVIVLHKEKTKK